MGKTKDSVLIKVDLQENTISSKQDGAITEISRNLDMNRRSNA
jgi:hypothetical protein